MPAVSWFEPVAAKDGVLSVIPAELRAEHQVLQLRMVGKRCDAHAKRVLIERRIVTRPAAALVAEPFRPPGARDVIAEHVRQVVRRAVPLGVADIRHGLLHAIVGVDRLRQFLRPPVRIGGVQHGTVVVDVVGLLRAGDDVEQHVVPGVAADLLAAGETRPGHVAVGVVVVPPDVPALDDGEVRRHLRAEHVVELDARVREGMAKSKR